MLPSLQDKFEICKSFYIKIELIIVKYHGVYIGIVLTVSFPTVYDLRKRRVSAAKYIGGYCHYGILEENRSPNAGFIAF